MLPRPASLSHWMASPGCCKQIHEKRILTYIFPIAHPFKPQKITKLNKKNADTIDIYNMPCYIGSVPGSAPNIKGKGDSMQKDVNIYDIALSAGVSKSTVSRVLNGHLGVKEETRRRVQQTIKDLTYIPNNSARSLSSLSTQAVVLFVCGITNPFFSAIISLLIEKLSQGNVDVILHSYEPNFDSAIGDVLISICKEKRPKGIILLGGSFEETYPKMRLISAPIVMASTTIFGDSDRSWFSSVTIDDEAEGRNMASFICQHGHSKIAIVGQHHRREIGISEVFKARGITPVSAQLPPDRAYSFWTGYKAAKKLLENGEYTCLLCLSDVLAIGAMKAVQEKGLQVPGDVSVVGFDGIEYGAFTNPALTTFVQPAGEIAEKSVSVLLGLINEDKPHSHHILHTTLEKGESFKPLS